MENDTDPNKNNVVEPEISDSVTSTQEANNNPSDDAPVTNQSEVTKKRIKFPKIQLNRNTILAGSLALVLIIIGVATILLTRGNTEEIKDEEVVMINDESEKLGAAIIIKEGTIQIKPIDSGDWQDATTETEISEGVALRTVGATSRAVIAFDDGSALRIDANSEAELETVTVDRIVINHKSGYTYNRVLPSENLTYLVSSTDAQYEALGTAFKTASTGDEQSVEVYHSSVVETGTNKTPKEGEKLIVINKNNPSENGAISKIDIESVKSDSFMQWNRELDEKDENFKSSLGFLSDVTAPEISLNKNDGDVILLEPNATEGTIEISGKTESGAKVTVQSKSQSGSQPVDVTVGGDGSFTTPLLNAPVGDSVFEFITKDKTGNKSSKTLRITFQRKSQPVAGNAVSFVLTSSQETDKLQLNWVINGIEAKDGYKVVYEKDNENPVFNQGDSQSFLTKETTSSIDISKKFTESGTYYVKVCIYDSASGTCGQYSNSIKFVKS